MSHEHARRLGVFAPATAKIFESAGLDATAMGHDCVHAQHLLPAMLGHSFFAAFVFASLDDLATMSANARAAAARSVTSGQRIDVGELFPDAKRAAQYACNAAWHFGPGPDQVVYPIHLMLGLLADPDSVVFAVIQSVVSPLTLFDAAMYHLCPYMTPAEVPAAFVEWTRTAMLDNYNPTARRAVGLTP